uniref:Uncharacterized protein n=1 Tax=Octactis speculum TaxID=3111310 RepID=A0A7S2MMC4_9STRA|mmetsp:Transcript_6564/g.8113  ORF Transcript_6564/g.8113 Transcript_6564/m.8113 type:complete len:246 (+) Transcript_6564:43-780(+)
MLALLVTCSLFAGGWGYIHPLRDKSGVARVVRSALNDRFASPSVSQPSILDVARPLMNAAVHFERAGSIVVSLSADDSKNFKGGSQLINVARDLEDAGALSRMRPGIFMEEPQLKLRASSEALVEAAVGLCCPPFADAGMQMMLCGEELGRDGSSLQVSGTALKEAGVAICEGCAILRDMQASGLSTGKVGDNEKKSGWMSGFGADLVKVEGGWTDAIASLELAGGELKNAGEVLKSCRVAKKKM